MSARRPLTVLCALAAAFAVAGPAAAQPDAADYPETITTTHFRVHYTGELGNTARVLHQQAADVAELAERAYATLVTSWGYPAPLDDGDGLIDIWIQDLSAEGGLGLATKEPAGNPTAGWIAVDATDGRTMETVAHELFHLIQFGIWTTPDWWLLEGSAEWAAYAVDAYTRGNLYTTYGAPDMSLDCVSDACGDDGYEIGGYSRWTFFQYLAERYGKAFMRDVLVEGAAAGNAGAGGAALLANSVAARSTTLSALYTDYTATHMAAAYAEPALQNVLPPAHATVATPSRSAALAVRQIAVNHLAVRYVRFASGGTGGLCYAATLSLAVALPSGIDARPSFFSPSLGTRPLSVSGDTASISVPWNTCAGGEAAYLSLPNASLTSDARVFTVSGTLTVDTSTLAAPTAPPPLVYSGPTEAAPTAAVAPSIHVYGAQVVRVAAATRAVRLIVFSSGEGRLQATLGGAVVHTAGLRAGNNDVRFRLPARALAQLRRVSSTRASSVLALTSLSSTGAVGPTVRRTVAVVASKAPKTKAKAKPKRTKKAIRRT